MAFTKTFRESTTLKAVVAATILLFGKFAIGGFDFGYGTSDFIGATEFGIAFAAIWAIWREREYRKSKENK